MNATKSETVLTYCSSGWNSYELATVNIYSNSVVSQFASFNDTFIIFEGLAKWVFPRYVCDRNRIDIFNALRLFS